VISSKQTSKLEQNNPPFASRYLLPLRRQHHLTAEGLPTLSRDRHHYTTWIGAIELQKLVQNPGRADYRLDRELLARLWDQNWLFVRL